jgi:hypothetical protein
MTMNRENRENVVNILRERMLNGMGFGESFALAVADVEQDLAVRITPGETAEAAIGAHKEWRMD